MATRRREGVVGAPSARAASAWRRKLSFRWSPSMARPFMHGRRSEQIRSRPPRWSAVATRPRREALKPATSTVADPAPQRGPRASPHAHVQGRRPPQRLGRRATLPPRRNSALGRQLAARLRIPEEERGSSRHVYKESPDRKLGPARSFGRQGAAALRRSAGLPGTRRGVVDGNPPPWGAKAERRRPAVADRCYGGNPTCYDLDARCLARVPVRPPGRSSLGDRRFSDA